MNEFILILIVTAVVVAVCGILIGVKIIFQKNGKFSHTCAFDWEKEKCKDCSGNCTECTVNIGKISVN